MARRTQKPTKVTVTPASIEDAQQLPESAPPQLEAEPVHETHEGPQWLTLAPMLLGAGLLVLGLLLPRAETSFPDVAQMANGFALLALGLAAGGLLLARSAERNALAVGLLTAAAAIAVTAFRLRECAFPALGVQATEPLRTSLGGLTLPIATAVALGGALALKTQNFRTARAWLALGATLQASVLLVPQGWLGQTVVPLWSAIVGLSVPTTNALGVQFQTSALSGSGLLMAGALLVAVAVWALIQTQLARVVWLALTVGLALLLVAPPVLSGNLAHGCATAGALLLAAGALGHAIAQLADAREIAVSWTRTWRGVEWVAVPTVLAIWLVLKANGTRYSTTDEALYYYAAKIWTEGKWPYRDFFFSHPPLHIAAPALAYKLFGYDFLVGKWLSVFASLGASLATWRIARRLLGVPAGVLALALNLFGAETLQASTNLTGVNLTTCWMMWGVWAILRGRFFLGGALIGAAAATGFYALGMMLAMVAMLAFVPLEKQQASAQRWLGQPAVRVFGGFMAIWGTITLLGWLLAGDRYVTQVFSYHFAKKAKVDGFMPVSGGPPAWINNLFLMLGAKDFIIVLYYHAVHLWLSLLAPLAVGLHIWLGTQTAPPVRKANEPSPWQVLWHPRAWWQSPATGHRMVLFIAALALVGEFAQFKERYDFYWALILPLLSICAAVTLHTLFELGAAAAKAHVPRLDAFAPVARYAFAILALVSVQAVPINNAANTKAYPSEFKVMNDSKGAGETLTFEWLEPPGPAWVGQLTRAAFWGETRLRGNIESAVHHYLWNKKRWYSTADEMAAWIRDHSKPNETITGASDYAPLLALLSGRRMAADAVDTNSKVFDTGAVRLEDFWDAACKDNLKFIVVAPMSYFAPVQLPKRATITQHFQQDKVFADHKLKHWKDLQMELWVRKTDAPCKFEGTRGIGPNLQGSD